MRLLGAVAIAALCAGCNSHSSRASRPVRKTDAAPVVQPKEERSACGDLELVAEMRESIRRLHGDALILKLAPSYPEVEQLKTSLGATGALLVEPFVAFDSRLVSPSAMVTAPVRGFTRASSQYLDRYVVEGSLAPQNQEADEGAVALGVGLAGALGVKLGDHLRVVRMPQPWEVGARVNAASLHEARVTALLRFPGSVTSLNAEVALMDFAAARRLAFTNDPVGASGVMLRFRDGVVPERASLAVPVPGIVATINDALHNPFYRVVPGYDTRAPFESTIDALRISCQTPF